MWRRIFKNLFYNLLQNFLFQNLHLYFLKNSYQNLLNLFLEIDFKTSYSHSISSSSFLDGERWKILGTIHLLEFFSPLKRRLWFLISIFLIIKKAFFFLYLKSFFITSLKLFKIFYKYSFIFFLFVFVKL